MDEKKSIYNLYTIRVEGWNGLYAIVARDMEDALKVYREQAREHLKSTTSYTAEAIAAQISHPVKSITLTRTNLMFPFSVLRP